MNIVENKNNQLYDFHLDRGLSFFLDLIGTAALHTLMGPFGANDLAIRMKQVHELLPRSKAQDFLPQRRIPSSGQN